MMHKVREVKSKKIRRKKTTKKQFLFYILSVENITN